MTIYIINIDGKPTATGRTDRFKVIDADGNNVGRFLVKEINARYNPTTGLLSVFGYGYNKADAIKEVLEQSKTRENDNVIIA